MFRRAMKRAVQTQCVWARCKGIKVEVSGRLGGAEIARTESLPRRSRTTARSGVLTSTTTPLKRTPLTV